MSRCYICDWTPGSEQSDYHLCLLEKDFTFGKNFLLIDSENRTICHHCDSKSQNDILDDEFPVLDKDPENA